jgi:hypothetical protein
MDEAVWSHAVFSKNRERLLKGFDLPWLCAWSAEEECGAIFRRMLASHQRSLAAARGHQESAGQIAMRELEIVRITGALQRAEELSDDVAPAIEGLAEVGQ